MTVFSFIWYGLCLILYPLRYALFVLHRLAIFITKPGALILLPAIAAGALLMLWSAVAATLDPIVTRKLVIIRDGFDPDIYAAIYPIRLELTALLAWGSGTILLILLSRLMRPLVGAFPAPRMPLMPHVPFTVPRFRVRSVRVRPAPNRLGPSRFDGNLDRIIRKMRPEIRDMLTSRHDAPGHYPGPATITETRPLWPPLSTAPVADPVPPEPGEPPAPAPAPPPRAKRATRKPPTSAKGNPPPPPASTRRRKAG